MGSLVSTQYGAKAADKIKKFNSLEEWKSHFNSLKESNQLMVIDFYASWCGPCKFMEPAVQNMANEYSNVQFVKIDVEELRDVAKEWKIEAMPTFVLVKHGKEVDRVVGADKEELETKIKKHRMATPPTRV